MTDGTLAGYRLLRRLGSGSRADVFLASGSDGTVALKVFETGVSRESVGAELDALGRVDSPHVARLLDLASSSGPLPTLVFERVPGGSLAALLRGRVDLEAGEAVTLLAPIAHLLPELHHAGVVHTRIGAGSIHLGESGEPVLLGLGHCELFTANGTIAALDARPAVVDDRDAFAALAVSILGQVRDAVTNRRIRELSDWIENVPRVHEFLPDLESRLFDLADAMPIQFGGDEGLESAVPMRIGMPVPEIREPREVVEPTANQSKASPWEPPPWLPAVLLENPVAQVRERLGTFVRGVRKPFWIVAGGIVLAFVLAATLIPTGATQASPKGAGVRETSIPEPTPSALPDDPVLALPVLLRAREDCIRDLSILCLDSVDESSSGAFLQDSAIIQQIQQGGEIPKSATIDSSAPTLVERLGDSALVSLGVGGDLASVLLIKGASGWRIRDELTGVQATATPTG
jgi:hypothetical protein